VDSVEDQARRDNTIPPSLQQSCGNVLKEPQALHCYGIGGRGGIKVRLGGVPGATTLCLQHSSLILHKGNTLQSNFWVQSQSATVGKSSISRGRDCLEEGFRRIPS
jgi:hypothetical protein